AFSHLLALIHQLFDNFTRHPEAKVAFCAGMHGPGVTRRARVSAADREAAHEAAGICCNGRLAIPAEQNDTCTDDNANDNWEQVRVRARWSFVVTAVHKIPRFPCLDRDG